MTTTHDYKPDPKMSLIKRDFVSHLGEVYATATLFPSVLPMTGFSFDPIEASVWLVAVRNKGVITKGALYRLAHIHSNGQIMVAHPHAPDQRALALAHYGAVADSESDDPTLNTPRGAGADVLPSVNGMVQGLWPMDLFAEYVIAGVKLHDTAPDADREATGAGANGEAGRAGTEHQSPDGGAAHASRPRKARL